jgi:hypothetical protein
MKITGLLDYWFRKLALNKKRSCISYALIIFLPVIPVISVISTGNTITGQPSGSVINRNPQYLFD